MLETAIAAARAAGRVLYEGSRREIAVDQQMRHDVKLALDKKSETTIVNLLRQAFPDHAILAEESGNVGAESEWEWVIDPLDGTHNLFRGIPAWTTSIGLRKGDEEILGVIYDPIRDELFSAEQGKGAFMNGRPIHVSDVAPLKDSVIATGYAANDAVYEKAADMTREITLAADKIRILGSAAMHLAYVACGRIDGFFEYALWPWDIVAGVALIREAGGQVTTRYYEDNTVDTIGSNGLIHAEMEAHIL